LLKYEINIMTWIPYALFAVMCAVATPLLQRRSKVDTLAMLFWLRVITVVTLVPVVFFIGLPTGSLFYIVMIIFGILVTYTDFLFFRFVRHNNPAIATRLLKPTVIVTFLLWFVLDPDLLERYMDQPGRAIVIVALLIMAVIFASKLKQCNVTRSALIQLWPVLCSAAIYPIISKYILIGVDPWVGAVGVYFTTAVVVLITLTIVQMRTQKIPTSALVNVDTIKVSALITVPSLLGGLALVMAFQDAANPAYVSVMMMIVPVILSIVGHILGDPDRGNQRAGFGLLAIATLIVFLQIR